MKNIIIKDKSYLFATVSILLWSTSAIGFTSWVMALEKGDTAKISNLAYITPFLSLIWIALILKEKISIFSIIGLIVIVLGIIIQLKDKR